MTTNCTGRKKQLSVTERARFFWTTDLDVLDMDLLGAGRTVVDLPRAKLKTQVVYLPKDD